MYKVGDIFNERSGETVTKTENATWMPINGVHPAQVLVLTAYSHQFDYLDEPGSGLAFPVDAEGNLLHPEPGRVALLAQALSGVVKGHVVIDLGVVKEERVWREPPVIRCACGQKLDLYDPFTSTCAHCGRDYNGAGQMLAPRSWWGEETGETLGDILGPE